MKAGLPTDETNLPRRRFFLCRLAACLQLALVTFASGTSPQCCSPSPLPARLCCCWLVLRCDLLAVTPDCYHYNDDRTSNSVDDQHLKR